MSSISEYLILNNTNYFAVAEEYIQLNQRFKTDTFYETFGLFMKLIGNLLLAIIWKSQALSLSFTIYRMVEDWKEYITYLKSRTKIREWKELVRSVGGPFISTNDDLYQPYVYADGMQRLHNALFGLAKERAKRLE
jgi:hypothetical protein